MAEPQNTEPRTNPPERVTIELGKSGTTGGLQLSINAYEEDGTGDGYRLFGPKFDGTSLPIVSTQLTRRDVQEIRSYLDRTGY
jgi:hypothetical protein